MHERGYIYATLTRSTAMNFTVIDPTLGLGDCHVPSNALYFSKLEEAWESEEDEVEDYVPAWYKILNYESMPGGEPTHPQLPRYEGGNIAFAMIDTSELIKADADKALIKKYEYDWRKYDWEKMRRETGKKGFQLESFDPNYSGWDVSTVVVWNPDVLTEVVFFKRAHEPFTYWDNEVKLEDVRFAQNG